MTIIARFFFFGRSTKPMYNGCLKVYKDKFKPENVTTKSVKLFNDNLSALWQLRTSAPNATAHPYSARKFTSHVMHRARAKY